MADWGVKVSKEGKAITSAEPKDYIINSTYNDIKIISQGLGTITTGSGTIAHGQSFTPMTMVFFELQPASNNWYGGAVKYPAPVHTSGKSVYDISYGTAGTRVDGTSVHLELNSGTTPIKYYYYIFGDNGA